MKWGKPILSKRMTVVAVVVLVLGFLAPAGFLGYLNQSERYLPLVEKSDSMKPALKPGDLLVISRLRPEQEIEPGMIITFRLQEGALITHRVESIVGGEYITKGDANLEVDHWSNEAGQEYRITRQDVVGVYWGRVPVLGHVQEIWIRLFAP